MPISDQIARIQTQLGRELKPAGEAHLPLDLRLQRMMLPDDDKQGTYLLEGGELVALNLSGMQLAESQLGFLGDSYCHSLQGLCLSHNQFTQLDLPASLQSLRYLTLSDNASLMGLTFSKGLTSLKRLDLTACGLQKLVFPAGFEALEFIDLMENKQLGEIAFEGEFPNLLCLYLSSCNLSRLELGNHFPKLAYLLMNGNRLAEPPVVPVGGCPAMETLDLRENQLKNVEADFLLPYPNLLNLFLDENPLPEAILSNLNGAPSKELAFIERYTDNLASKGSDLDATCKVLLVGNGKVGKSCLVKRLVYNEFDPEWDSTQGIQLEEYPQAGESDPLLAPYRLNIWDFGGQDIYHATHRLFMQASAVYLVLWDQAIEENLKPTAREEMGKERMHNNYSLAYWLSYAKSLGKDSPAIVVQTKVGKEGQHKKDQPAIRNAFKPLAFRHIESSVEDRDDNGYNELLLSVKKAVKRVKKQHKLSNSWAAIRTQIEQLQQAGEQRMDVQEFEALVIKNGYSTPSDVLNWLSQSGVFFYQKGLFNNEIILDQAWAIEAIYTLFDRNKNYYKFLNNPEGFSGKDLASIWTDNTAGERELFVSFMLSCEICFETTPKDEKRHQVPFEERTFVAPQLLPKDRPEMIDDFWEDKNALYMQYQHDFLHHGVIQQFIVRTHYLANPLGKSRNIWRSGIHLKDQGHYAKVEATGAGLQKTLTVTATHGAKTLLDKIRNELDELQDQPGHVTVSVDGKKFVELTTLEARAKDSSAKEIRCTNGTYLDIDLFAPFLNRDQNQRFEQPEKHAETLKSHIMTIREIKQLIAQGRLKKAIEVMLQEAPAHLEDSIFQLQGSFNQLERKGISGVLTQEQQGIETNRLVSRALALCNQFEMPVEFEKKAMNEEVKASPKSDASDSPTKTAEIYFSYTWGKSQEVIVDQLYESLMKDGFNIIRDKKDLGFGKSIKGFMEDLGESRLIVVFISDKYVRSSYCMFELLEIAVNSQLKKEQFQQRVLPIRVEDIAFDRPKILREYHDYWEAEEKEWEEYINDKTAKIGKGQFDRYNQVKKINAEFGELADWLQDMNAMTNDILAENNFEMVKKAIIDRLKK